MSNDWKNSQFELLKNLYNNEVFAHVELTPSAKLFLWALCSHFNPKRETMFPAQATVAKRLGMSERSAERAVKELRDKGLITYTTKRVNHYVFAQKFFDLVKMSGKVGQNVGCEDRQNVALTNKHEQINNKEIFKNNFSDGAKNQLNISRNTTKTRVWGGVTKVYQPGGKAIPSIEETREYIEEREKIRAQGFNPLDYTKKEALNWLRKADIAWLQYSGIARQLVLKYKLREFEFLLKPAPIKKKL